MLRLREPDARTDAAARELIGAAIEVHRCLGPGFLESIYENALCVELRLRGISFDRQKPAIVEYKGEFVGEGRLDLLVDEVLVVEIKAVKKLIGIHTAQVLSYLKATGLTLGLLINFNSELMRDGIRRVVLT